MIAFLDKHNTFTFPGRHILTASAIFSYVKIYRHLYDWGYNAYPRSYKRLSTSFQFSTYIFLADITPEMLKLRMVTKVKVFSLVLVYVFNFDLFEISAAILEKGPLDTYKWTPTNPSIVNNYSPKWRWLATDTEVNSCFSVY